jgi:hypothetical protein
MEARPMEAQFSSGPKMTWQYGKKYIYYQAALVFFMVTRNLNLSSHMDRQARTGSWNSERNSIRSRAVKSRLPCLFWQKLVFTLKNTEIICFWIWEVTDRSQTSPWWLGGWYEKGRQFTEKNEVKQISCYINLLTCRLTAIIRELWLRKMLTVRVCSL